MTDRARAIVRDLFGWYMDDPARLPKDWQRGVNGKGTAKTARVVADYIAGMTDRFAFDEHRRIFNAT